jgi:hypothetical protein
VIGALESAPEASGREPIIQTDVLDPQHQSGAALALPVVGDGDLWHGEEPEGDGGGDAEIVGLRHDQRRR